MGNKLRLDTSGVGHGMRAGNERHKPVSEEKCSTLMLVAAPDGGRKRMAWYKGWWIEHPKLMAIYVLLRDTHWGQHSGCYALPAHAPIGKG